MPGHGLDTPIRYILRSKSVLREMLGWALFMMVPAIFSGKLVAWGVDAALRGGVLEASQYFLILLLALSLIHI